MNKFCNLKKHQRIYCVLGLICLATIGLSEITQPSYALLTSTVQTSITFSAADSFPEKDVIIPVQEPAPPQTLEIPSEGVEEEQSTTETDAENSTTESAINQTVTESSATEGVKI